MSEFSRRPHYDDEPQSDEEDAVADSGTELSYRRLQVPASGEPTACVVFSRRERDEETHPRQPHAPLPAGHAANKRRSSFRVLMCSSSIHSSEPCRARWLEISLYVHKTRAGARSARADSFHFDCQAWSRTDKSTASTDVHALNFGAFVGRAIVVN